MIAPAAAAVPLLSRSPSRCLSRSRCFIRGRMHPAAIKPDVLSYYLNVPSFIVRTMLALIGWSALALLLPRTTGVAAAFWRALGLVFHALIISSRRDRLVFVARSAVHLVVVRRQRRHLVADRSAGLDRAAGAAARRMTLPSAMSAACSSPPFSASPTSISWPCW